MRGLPPASRAPVFVAKLPAKNAPLREGCDVPWGPNTCPELLIGRFCPTAPFPGLEPRAPAVGAALLPAGICAVVISFLNGVGAEAIDRCASADVSFALGTNGRPLFTSGLDPVIGTLRLFMS